MEYSDMDIDDISDTSSPGMYESPGIPQRKDEISRKELYQQMKPV